MMDTWAATLSDGRKFTEQSAELVGPRSPWRQLEALAQGDGLLIHRVRIERAQVFLGVRTLELDAGDGVLVCGQHIDFEIPLDGSPQRKIRYRWILRQSTDRWLWRITDGRRAWEIETVPRERIEMPSPSAIAEVN